MGPEIYRGRKIRRGSRAEWRGGRPGDSQASESTTRFDRKFRERRAGRARGEREKGVVDPERVFAASDERRRAVESCARNNCRNRCDIESTNGRGHESVASQSRGPCRWQNTQPGSAKAAESVIR